MLPVLRLDDGDKMACLAPIVAETRDLRHLSVCVPGRPDQAALRQDLVGVEQRRQLRHVLATGSAPQRRKAHAHSRSPMRSVYPQKRSKPIEPFPCLSP